MFVTTNDLDSLCMHKPDLEPNPFLDDEQYTDTLRIGNTVKHISANTSKQLNLDYWEAKIDLIKWGFQHLCSAYKGSDLAIMKEWEEAELEYCNIMLRLAKKRLK